MSTLTESDTKIDEILDEYFAGHYHCYLSRKREIRRKLKQATEGCGGIGYWVTGTQTDPEQQFCGGCPDCERALLMEALIRIRDLTDLFDEERVWNIADDVLQKMPIEELAKAEKRFSESCDTEPSKATKTAERTLRRRFKKL